MYILFSSQCPLHFKCCNELTFALHFSSLVCFSHGHFLSGSSKKTHHCSAVRARLSHKSNTFLRPLTLSNGVGEWWKPFCIPGRSNVTGYNLSKQDAWIFFFSKWWPGWLKSSIPMTTPSSHSTPKGRERQAGKREINYLWELPIWILGKKCLGSPCEELYIPWRGIKCPHNWLVRKITARIQIRLGKSGSHKTSGKHNQSFRCIFNYFIRY